MVSKGNDDKPTLQGLADASVKYASEDRPNRPMVEHSLTTTPSMLQPVMRKLSVKTSSSLDGNSDDSDDSDTTVEVIAEFGEEEEEEEPRICAKPKVLSRGEERRKAWKRSAKDLVINFVRDNKEIIDELFMTHRRRQGDEVLVCEKRGIGQRSVVSEADRAKYNIPLGIVGKGGSDQGFLVRLRTVMMGPAILNLPAKYVYFEDPRDAGEVFLILKQMLTSYMQKLKG